MTKEERASYSYYQKKLYNDRDELQAAAARGKAEGKADIAKRMLAKGRAPEEIIEFTGLTIEEVVRLKD